MRKNLFSVGVFMVGIVLAASVAAAPRLALLADGADAVVAADILSVAFSAKENVQLFERAEIEKILREQGLSASSENCLKLGRILGADGVLLLDTEKKDGKASVRMRLVAVSPGVSLAFLRVPWPVPDPDKWAQWVSGHFDRLYPKLVVRPGDAIPISIVNIRSAAASADAQETERQVTSLLLERLIAEPNLFVLERKRMEALSFEKTLPGGDETAFWNGSYLLEGVLDRDGYAKDTLTLNARLIPPNGGTPVPLDLEAPRKDLAGAVDKLAAQLVAHLKPGSPRAPWSPAEEAARYLQEAEWAAKWGMLDEWQSAIEASWALGNRTRRAAESRARVYRELADPHWNANAVMAPTLTNSRPDPSKLPLAIRAVRLYQDGIRTYLASDPKPDPEWHSLALDLLSSVSQLLDQFNFFPETCQGHEEDLAELRGLVRDTVEMLNKLPDFGKLRGNKHTFIYARNGSLLGHWTTGMDGFDLPTMMAAEGACWYDKPEQCLEMYRELVRAGRIGELRQYIRDRRFMGWTPEDKKRCPALWDSFLAELCASPDPVTKISGYWLAFEYRGADEDCIEKGRQLIDVSLANAWVTCLPDTKDVEDRLFIDVDDVVCGLPTRGVPGGGLNGVVTAQFRDFQQRFRKAADAEIEERKPKWRRDCLAGNVFEVKWFAVLFHWRKFSEADARELLPLLAAYEVRLLALHPVPQDKRLRDDPAVQWYNSFNWSVRHLEKTLQDTLAPARPPKNKPGAGTAAARPQPTPPPAPAPATTPAGTAPPAWRDRVRVTRFWQTPDIVKGEPGSEAAETTISACCFREGRLWLEVIGTLRARVHKAVVLGVDLGTFETIAIELPLERTKYEANYRTYESVSTGVGFEVIGQSLYFCLDEKVKRCDLRTRTWEDLPVPVRGEPRLTAAGGHLFITTNDSIMQLNDDGKGVKLMASSRRRPAVTVLDSLENYNCPPVLPTPDGMLLTVIADKVYGWDNQANDWVDKKALVPPLSAAVLKDFQDRVFCASIPGGWILGSKEYERQADWWFVPRSQKLDLPTPEEVRNARAQAHYQPVPLPLASGVTRWADVVSSWFATPVCADGDTIWAFSHDLEVVTLEQGCTLAEKGGVHVSLFEFARDKNEARVYPLWFDVPTMVFKDRTAYMQQVRRLYGEDAYQKAAPVACHVRPVATPAGIVVVSNSLYGFCLISRADLQSPSAPGNLRATPKESADALWKEARLRYAKSGTADTETGRIFQTAADQGDALAAMWVARLTQRGWCGLAKDADAAAKLAQKAMPDVKRLAAAGDADAQFILGMACLEGIGAATDPKEAWRWLLAAAEHGEPLAMNNLGAMLLSGGIVPRDEAKGAAWIEKAAGLGDRTAISNVGQLYHWGAGVDPDLQKAREWYTKAIGLGYDLGSMLDMLTPCENTHSFSAAAIRRMPYVKLLGTRSEELSKTAAAGGIVPAGAVLAGPSPEDSLPTFSYRANGILFATRFGRIWTVELYAQGVKDFDQFTGELPLGLAWDDTRESVAKKLGEPDGQGDVHQDTAYGMAYLIDNLSLAVMFDYAPPGHVKLVRVFGRWATKRQAQEER